MKVYKFIPILGMFILPACQLDEPTPTAGDTSDRYLEFMVDLISKVEQGDADAQYSLGLMYEFGIGIPQDYEEAIRWYRAAAEQRYAKGQYSLGSMYYYGQRVLPRILTPFRVASERMLRDFATLVNDRIDK